MCRLYGFRANEPTKVECSLVHAQNALLLQSRKDSLGRSHADGWGLASFHDSEITLEKRDAAAFEDLHFGSAAERIYGTTVVAHVRRATVGGPSARNTHPFRYRRWVFAHNGTVADFDNVGPRLASETEPRLEQRREGTTDSEQAFLWLLSRLDRSGADIDGDSAAVDVWKVAGVTAEAVRLLGGERSKLNFLLTNGSVLVATRYHNSLYLLERDGVRDCEICGIPHVHHDRETSYRAVVVASEPITQEAWREVPDEHVVSVDSSLGVEVKPLA